MTSGRELVDMRAVIAPWIESAVAGGATPEPPAATDAPDNNEGDRE